MTLTSRALHCLLSLLCIGTLAFAQEVLEEQPPTVVAVQAQLDLLQNSETPGKEEIASAYTQAMQELERAKKLDQRTAEFERQLLEAPGLLESIRKELAEPPIKDEPVLPAGVAVRELEQEQQQAEADRVAAAKMVEDLSGEARHRTERSGSIAEDLARVRSLFAERESSLRATTISDALGVSRRTLLQSELLALKAEERSLQSERACYEARRELLPLRRDRAQRKLTRSEQLVQFWQRTLANQRQQDANEAKRVAEQQRKETAARFPKLKAIAARNEELASMRSGDAGVPAQIARAKNSLLETQQLRDETARRLQSTRRKIEVGGLTEGMGLLLQRENEWTQDPRKLEHDSKLLKEALSRAQLLQLTLQEERDKLGDVATRQENIIASLGLSEKEAADPQLATLIPELLNSQRSLLDALIEELSRLISAQIEHERANQALLESTVVYRHYIEQRILWIPSTIETGLSSFNGLSTGIVWLINPREWRTAMGHSKVAAQEQFGQCILWTLVIASLLVARKRVRASLLATSEGVRSYRTDRFTHTLKCLLDTVGLALPMPLLLYAIGWVLSMPDYQVEVAVSVGHGLQAVAFQLFVLELLRQGIQEKHLAESHFRWHTKSTSNLRRELKWFIPVALFFEILVVAYYLQSVPAWNDSVGRIAFIGLLSALSVVLFRMLGPSGRVLGEHYKRSAGMLERTQRLWYSLLLAVPIALIILALSGYYYTALHFANSLNSSIGLGLGLLLVNALLLRWLFIERRRLAIEQARQRAQSKAQAAETSETPPSTELGTTAFDEERVDIPAVDAQTRKLFTSGVLAATLIGIFFIWADSFSALQALNRVQLWPEVRIVAEVDSSLEVAAPVATVATSMPQSVIPMSPALSAQPDAQSTAELPNPIFLADLLLALVIFLLTSIITKNAPGVLEIAVLQRLPFDSGSRYALSTLFRYIILIVGFSAGFGAIGIGWGTVQWLAAALTFGLAFGLQEIFANFVSGIIILIERPIRVGDIVTVGETEGRVTKLRMRATTILDWNRRELLVPNKEFITGSVVNWTLSDPVTRMVISVGIAYGSDTKLARSLLLKAAKENEYVLADPAPSAIFRSFGDSCLNFELRCFLSNRDLWPQLVDRLHTQIDDAFRVAGVEISFPQRDLHIRSAEGLRGIMSEKAATHTPSA